MLARATRPKLSLAVPALALPLPTPAIKSALPPTPVLSSPISPTVHNTRLNQRGFSTLQPPTFAYSQASSSSGTKSILKRGAQKTAGTGKKLQFREEAEVRCVTPVPRECHGTYVKMSRDERRWGARGQ